MTITARSYIPTKERIFYPWSKNLVNVSKVKGVQWGILPTDTENLDMLFSIYETKYQISIDPATRTAVTVQEKNDAKKALTSAIREYCMGHLLHNHLVTDSDRKLLELPVYDHTHTPAPLPHTAPVGIVDTSAHQRHTLRVTDSVEERPRGGLPKHVSGFEAWRKVGGAPPADDDDFEYLNFSSTTSMVVEYTYGQVGVTVWYRFRWVNSRNQPGPWSEGVLSAVIP